jgi:hypothetical protein
MVGPNGGKSQTDIWKLTAATELLNLTSWFLDDLGHGVDKRGLQAYVQHPFALVMGNLNITKNGSIYEINCLTCNLTACTSTYNKGETIFVVKHVPYLLVPTNLTGPWYHDKGLQFIKEVKSLLVREKRVTGLIIASIVAAITAIATMAMASVALSQNVQNAHYGNTLTQNATYTLQQQVSIDEKIDVLLNT